METRSAESDHREKMAVPPNNFYLDYAPEICAWCKGVGSHNQTECSACDGKGKVMVCQPPIKCPRCKGVGKSDGSYFYATPFCVVCRGCGWVLTL